MVATMKIREMGDLVAWWACSMVDMMDMVDLFDMLDEMVNIVDILEMANIVKILIVPIKQSLPNKILHSFKIISKYF